MGAALWIVVRAMLELTTGKRGPQDIPASHVLFVLTFIFYMATSAGLTAVAADGTTAVRATLVDALVMPAFVVSMLWLRNFTARWLQTLTAMAGVGVLFSLAAIPPFLVSASMPGSPFAAPASVLVLVLFIWNVLVLAHILRHALALAFPAGVLVAVAYVAVSMFAAEFLVPEVLT
jgi:hypothetical protein